MQERNTNFSKAGKKGGAVWGTRLTEGNGRV
jgi:hypothetical protein